MVPAGSGIVVEAKQKPNIKNPIGTSLETEGCVLLASGKRIRRLNHYSLIKNHKGQSFLHIL